MKTSTFKKQIKTPLLKWRFLLWLVVASSSSVAQIQNNQVLHVTDNSYVYTGSNTFIFGAGATTTTTRTTNNYGKIIFDPTATSSGASNTHFLDGYGSVATTSAFTFPIGQTGVYAPTTVTPTTTAAVDAAYYRASTATIGTSFDTTLSGISTTEYWNIQSTTTAVVNLTWRPSSTLSNIVLSTTDLTIAGYNGSQWVAIPSVAVGGSTLSTGSITSSSPINLAVYKYFSFAAKGNACTPLVASSGVTKTYNGSWSPSAPTIVDPVIISTAYAAGSFACNSLVLNANVTLTNGQNIEIVNGVTGAGKIIMSSEASVVQRASGATAPNIELTKKTRSAMRRYDYVYWGTPISGNFFTQIANAQASTSATAAAFDLKYKYISGAGGGWQTLTSTETGKGFIARIKEQAPFTNATNTDFINMKFTGVANNGDITIPITNNLSLPDSGGSHVLLANPYPSALDADKFLTENTTIDGVVYIWTSGTVNNSNGQLYSQSDYIAYTKAGAVVPASIPTTFNGKIASGQAFKVKSLTNAGSVTFTNCMRLIDNNNQFFKGASVVTAQTPKDRFKINMTGDNAVFSQILVAYLPETTLNYDRLYDAGRNSVSTAQLYSIYETDGRKLAINARPTFFATDVVPLGISKSNTNNESFTISLAEKEGIFNTTQADVYIYDRINGTYHNLTNSDLTFSTASTTLNDRFTIVYQTPTLNTSLYNDALTVTANIKGNVLTINAGAAMVNVAIFDLTGKKIYDSNIANATEFSAIFNHAQAIYIAKVQLENGTVANIKLINQK